MFELKEIESAEIFDGDMEMFDLTVEEDKSYNANGFIVHNSAYCESMDGRKFRADDPLLNDPPAHYQCRAIVVGITTIEVDREGGIKIDSITNVPRAKGFSESGRMGGGF